MLETRENYDKYVHLVEERAVGVQTRIVLGDMGVWFDAHPNEPAIKWPEFLAWVRTHRQTHWHVHQIEDYERFVNAALGGTAPAGEKILGKLHELAYIHRINDVV
ncbi:MAG: hypothetical protein NZM12_11685, partial [Steroidobacteraceae bacterium]|nr:hypothetical protein [Steroidobacteraceae bacterium]MDW8259509.1 hypothetical protein [Gammaproteobacteria bacterium]